MSIYMLHFNTSREPDYPFWNYGAAGKCHFDRETFAQQMGAQLLYGYGYRWNDEPNESLSVRMDGIFGGLKRNDIVIVQWSVPVSPRWVQMMIAKVHTFGAKLVFLIDDVGSWRLGDPLPAEVTGPRINQYKMSLGYLNEIHFFKQADGLIVHSKSMAQRLREQAAITGDRLPDSVAYYGPSGYVSHYFQTNRQADRGIDYAGSIDKARFLVRLPQTLDVNIFGDMPEDMVKATRKMTNIHFHARVDPEAVVQILTGSYGLVWDSNSYPTVTGPLGEYERYNTPAKFPMYLAANEPVIVWAESPLAKFVTGNHIGFALNDLTELPAAIASVDETQYQEMIRNVQRVSPLIRDGYYVKRAIIDIEEQVLGIVAAER